MILKGNLFQMSHDSILTIIVKDGHIPIKGQEVKVFKSFKTSGFSGTIGVANGKVISIVKNTVKVQVTLYTSTKTVKGKRIPMIKRADNVQLKW